MPINEYYLEHKDHVLGELEVVEMYNRNGLTCRSKGNTYTALSARLQEVISQSKRSNVQINAQKLDKRIADINFKIRNLQKELQWLLSTKQQVHNLQAQIDTLLTEAA